MEPVVVAAIAALLVLGSWAVQARMASEVREEWLTAARQAGLVRISITGRLAPRLAASTQDGIRISAWCQASRHVGERELHLRALEELPQFVSLSPESRFSRLEKRLSGPDVETGDAEFDNRVLVHGRPLELLAVLDQPTRQAVLELIEAGGTVSSGELVATFPGAPTSAADLLERLKHALGLVRRLREPRKPAPRLARNAVQDPAPGVRRRNLELLLEHFPGHRGLVAVLRKAAADPDAAVRLLAAGRLGDEGVPVLVDLAGNAATPPPIAAAATRAAGAALGSDGVAAVLDRALAGDLPDLALAAVEALGHCTGDQRAAQRLAAVLTADDVPLAAAAAKALVAALDHASREVRLAAAAALAEVGAVTAVAALRAAVAAHPADLGLRRAAAAAVGAIQQRAAGAGPGQVSLAESASGGEVAMADDDGGRLGLAGEPPTRDEG